MAEKKAEFGVSFNPTVARYAVFVKYRLDLCAKIYLFVPATGDNQPSENQANEKSYGANV
jgi:hypothetical protein